MQLRNADHEWLQEFYRRLGDVIKVERERQKITQDEASQALRVSQNVISQWEKGSTSGAAKIESLVALESLFGLKQRTILDRAGYGSDDPDLESIVRAHKELTDEQKDVLIPLIRLMINGTEED